MTTVLCVITNEEQSVPLTLWSLRFAHAYRATLKVVLVNSNKKPALLQNSVTQLKREIEEKHGAFIALGDSEISFQAGNIQSAETEIPKLIKSFNPSLLVFTREQDRPSSEDNKILEAAFLDAPCATVALRIAKADPYTCEKILVAVSGGAHSPVALQLAYKCQQTIKDCKAVALNVNTETTHDGLDVATLVVKKALKRAQVPPNEIQQRIITANTFAEGLSQVTAEDDYHLILVGSSCVGILRRLLFGTIPEELMSKTDGPAIAVIRSAKPLLSRASICIEDWLDLTIPQLSRDDRVRVIENLRANSQWNFDFMALMCLSTAIASLGLLQNSGAVVIGAMLVAPLMTPLLGAGLSLVQGNLPLMNSAGRSLGFGFVTALGVSLAIGACTNSQVLTPEMAARGGPSVLDMLVGFLAGLAAAYSSSRANLSAALPGVAIAAALVPPVATIGLSVTIAEYNNAVGAALLFAVNVVCITLGAGLSFFASGIRWQAVKKEQANWFWGITIAMMAVSLALGYRWTPPLSPKFHKELEAVIAEQLPLAEVQALSLQNKVLLVTLENPGPVPTSLPQDILRYFTSHGIELQQVKIHTNLVTSTTTRSEDSAAERSTVD